MRNSWQMSRVRRRERAQIMRAGRTLERRSEARSERDILLRGIERVFRYVEMIGISALLTIAVRGESPVVIAAVATASGTLAGYYLMNPLIEYLLPFGFYSRKRTRLLVASIALIGASVASGHLTHELARLIMAAIGRG